MLPSSLSQVLTLVGISFGEIFKKNSLVVLQHSLMIEQEYYIAKEETIQKLVQPDLVVEVVEDFAKEIQSQKKGRSNFLQYL